MGDSTGGEMCSVTNRRIWRFAFLAFALVWAGCRPPTPPPQPTVTVLPSPTRPRPTLTPTATVVPPAVRELINQLASEQAVERAQAAHELGLLGPEAGAAVGPLMALLDDRTELYAQFGLTITSPAQEAAVALARIGQPEGIARLVRELQKSDREARARAVIALYAARREGLEALRQTDAMPHLLAVAADSTMESRVRGYAIRVLGRLKEPEAVPTLGGLLRDPSEPVRVSAAWALGEIGDCHAVPYLIEALGTADETERFLIHAVLMQITGQSLGQDAEAWRAWWADQTCP